MRQHSSELNVRVQPEELHFMYAYYKEFKKF